jgi:hypothetical protein
MTMAAETARAPAAEGTPPHLELIGMATAIWKARALYAAACLGLADLLAGGPQDVVALAARTGTHAPSLHRLLRALASFGVLTEVEANRFALTRLGAALRRDAAGAARSTVLTLAGDWQWQAWSHFLGSLTTGRTGLAAATGQELFAYLAAHPQDGACFDEAMAGLYGGLWPAVVAAWDFSPLKSVADIGGGVGLLLAEILAAHPHMRGLLLEQALTAAKARQVMEQRGLTWRCEIVAGDFFAAVPPGYDAYVLAHVLHDWDDAQCLSILRRCREVMHRHARLLIVEAVLPDGDAPHPGKLLDLVMLTVTGGRERTEHEFARLLAAAGLRLVRVVPTAAEQRIVEAAAIW